MGSDREEAIARDDAAVPVTSAPGAVGKYQLIAELGQGGMAQVFLALSSGPIGFNKLVVLKALRPHLEHEPEFVEMFLDEARLAARLNHPHVVQTYEVGSEGGRHVIVMEYLEGQPYSRILNVGRSRGGIPLGLVLRVLRDALAGLQYAHDLKDFTGEPLHLVHRDVSPQNVFVTYDGQVKLLDFGIAKAATSSTETRAGELKGKVNYMAPEQMAGTPVDNRADLFSVGVMLWEAVAKRRMWRGLPDVAVMNKVLGGEVPRAADADPNIDPDLAEVIDRALSPTVEGRFATAAEMGAALDFVMSKGPDRYESRDLGRVVAELFGTNRKQMTAVIEEQMSKLSTLSVDKYRPAGVPALAVSGEVPIQSVLPSSVEGIAHTRYAIDGTLPSSPRRPGRRRALWGVMGALLLSGGVGAAFAVRRSGTSAAAQTPPAALPPPAAAVVAPSAETPKPPDPAAEIIEIKVAATPASARLTLDGETLASNPLVLKRPRDTRRHLLRADASGYVTAHVDVFFDRNGTFNLALERRAVEAPRAAPPPPAPRPAAPSKPPVNCDQPFAVDDRGIKTLRPECR